MSLKTGQQYIDSLRDVKIDLYYMGEKIENRVDHLAIRPHINAAAMTYDIAHDPEVADLATATSHLSGERINRFTHIYQSVEDLVKEIKLLRIISQRTGTCYQRCPGKDAMNALYGVTYEMDQAKGTDYHKRFVDFLRYVQTNDLMCGGGMTDPKGDRSLSPSKQTDPDLYLHVVEKGEKGIVVRGAKLHQTGSVNAHEFIALPTRAMGPEDADYAVSFAVPSGTKGMLYFFGRQGNDSRKCEGEIDQGNAQFGIVGGEALVVFEDVFVPWERVFMCGEHEFAGSLVERFASYHRQRYGGCRVGWGDVLIGATAAIAQYHGAGNVAHIRDKLTEMVHLNETLYCCGIACSSQGVPLPAGSYFVDPMLANICKHNVTRYIYELARLSQDIAGGLLATLPSEKELKDPKVGKYIEKYFKAVADVPTEHRFRIARLIENMSCGTALVEAMHGAGSPQAQRVMILRQANLEEKKKMALKIAGIEK